MHHGADLPSVSSSGIPRVLSISGYELLLTAGGFRYDIAAGFLGAQKSLAKSWARPSSATVGREVVVAVLLATGNGYMHRLVAACDDPDISTALFDTLLCIANLMLLFRNNGEYRFCCVYFPLEYIANEI